MTTLEPLYKNTKTSSIQVCIISYKNDTYYTELGISLRDCDANGNPLT